MNRRQRRIVLFDEFDVARKTRLRQPFDMIEHGVDVHRLAFDRSRMLDWTTHSQTNRELFRHDLQGAELRTFLERSPHEHAFAFYSTQFVDSWTVWPHSASRGWLDKITRKAVD